MRAYRKASSRRKKAYLVLIKKPQKIEEREPSSYRLICLIDEIAKLLERIIDYRLAKQINAQEGISKRQFGFLLQKTTVDAIIRIRDITIKAKKHLRPCALLGLDVSNAFNSLDWKSILRALDRYRLPEYLRNMVRGYLSVRTIWYELRDGHIYTSTVDRGVPQGSVLGPKLWIIAYDGVLRLPVPKGIRLIGFADDLIITIQGDNKDEIRERASCTTNIVHNKMKAMGLHIAPEKTELLMCAHGHKDLENLELEILRTSVVSTPPLNISASIWTRNGTTGNTWHGQLNGLQEREMRWQELCQT